MKNRIPFFITVFVGLVYLAEHFIHSDLLTGGTQYFNAWIPIVAAAAIALGVISLSQHHLKKIRTAERDWPYSMITLVSLGITVFFGLFFGVGTGSVFNWLYDHVFTPLRASMFSLLAFYLASAAFRAFRVRSLEATILLLSSFWVMLGRIPLGKGLCWGYVGKGAQWIIDFPTTAAMRAITMGVGLGILALSIKILIGKEKSHLG